MGMDAFEMMIEAEAALGIRLEDEEVASVRTAGDFYALVAARLDAGRRGRYLSMRVFHRLRCAMVRRFRQERRAVAPATPLAELFPRRARRADWALLAAATGYRLPELVLPRVIASLSLATTVGAFVSVVAGAIATLSAAALTFGMLMLFSKAWAMHWLTSPLANRFGAGVQTVGDLSKVVLACNFAEVSREAGEVHVAELWRCVRGIIGAAFGIAEEEITLETRLADLG